jgi:FdhD protein
MTSTARSAGTAEFTRLRFEDGHAVGDRPDVLAVEEPLEIRVEGQAVAVVMRTPGADRELAAGFLLTEGIIKSARDLFDITTCVTPGNAGAGNTVDAALANPASFDVEKLSRHVFTSSSCGICAKATIDSVIKRRRPLQDDFRVSSKVIFSLSATAHPRADRIQGDGRTPRLCLVRCRRKSLALREDVGRHNALDKLAGWALLQKRTPLSGHIVLLSGRSSFEMMQKAHAAGIAIGGSESARRVLSPWNSRAKRARRFAGLCEADDECLRGGGANRFGGRGRFLNHGACDRFQLVTAGCCFNSAKKSRPALVWREVVMITGTVCPMYVRA